MTNTQKLAAVIDSALAKMTLPVNQKTADFNWKIMFNEVEVQIAAADPLGNDRPVLSLYLVILRLPENNRSACVEELMRANFQTAFSKYALFDEFILQLVDIQQPEMLDEESFMTTLSLYTQHAGRLRQDLYVKYYQ